MLSKDNMERGEKSERNGVHTDCCPMISTRVRCVVTVICCFLFSCSLGTFYAFGNINPYLTSYLRNRTSSHDLNYTDTLWIYQALTIVTSVLMPLVGLLANHIHTKLFMAVGFLCHVGSFVATYWTMQESFTLVVLTYGILSGLPPAIIDPSAIRISVGWQPNRTGLVCAVVLMGYGAGAVVWNALTTWYINPNNLQPNLSVGQDLYYTQAAVLDRVPGCFLMLGVACGIIQVTGLLLVCLPPPASPQQAVCIEVSEEERRKLLDEDGDITDSPGIINSVNHDSEAVNCSVYGSVNDPQSTSGSAVSAACCRHAGEVKAAHTAEISQEGQYTPLQMLKSRVFWTLWLMYMCNSMGQNFVISLFKAYGETFISDDHFLSLVASLSSVCNAAGRPFWGLMSDRIGHRITSLIAQGVLAALVGSFMTCEVTGRVGFMLWVCAMFLTMCGIFTMQFALGISLFGSQHYNVNMGLLGSYGVIGTLMSGLVAPCIKDTLEWHGLFYIGFAGLFVGVLLNISLSIPWGTSIPHHMRPALSLPA